MRLLEGQRTPFEDPPPHSAETDAPMPTPRPICQPLRDESQRRTANNINNVEEAKEEKQQQRDKIVAAAGHRVDELYLEKKRRV